MIFGYSFDGEIFFLASMVLEDYNSLDMYLEILLRQINFVIFYGCHEEHYP
jgi:hypothetical protein